MPFNLFYCGAGIWDARPWLDMTRSDVGGIAIMEKKANILPVYVEGLYCGAANILKQELLSLGGELAVHKYAVNCKEEYGDVLILATYKEYRLLYKKLAMQHWKLKELSQELKILISNIMLAESSKTQIIKESDYQDLLRRKIDFTSSGNIVKDMAGLKLIEGNKSSECRCVEFSAKDFQDLGLLHHYNLALKSKGYQVLVKCTRCEERWIMQFIKPTYTFVNE